MLFQLMNGNILMRYARNPNVKTYIGELFGGSRDGERHEVHKEDYVLNFEEPHEVYLMVNKRKCGIFYYYEDNLLRKMNKGKV